MVSREPIQATIEDQATERVLASIATSLSAANIAKVEYIVKSIAQNQKRLGCHLDVDDIHRKAMGVWVLMN